MKILSMHKQTFTILFLFVGAQSGLAGAADDVYSSQSPPLFTAEADRYPPPPPGGWQNVIDREPRHKEAAGEQRQSNRGPAARQQPQPVHRYGERGRGYGAEQYRRPPAYSGSRDYRRDRNSGPWSGRSTPWSSKGTPWSGRSGRGGWMDKDSFANSWDDMLNAPSDIGEMPGGWRAPSVSVPNPVDVGDEFGTAAEDMPDQMRNVYDDNRRNNSYDRYDRYDRGGYDRYRR